jgi:HEXXH motif-containing protein
MRDAAVALPSVGRAVLSGVQPGVPSGVQPGVPSGVQPGVLSGVQPGDASRAVVRVPAGDHQVAAEVMVGGRRVSIPVTTDRDAPGWRGLRRISADAGGHSLEVVVDDVDPHRFPRGLALAARLDDPAIASLHRSLESAWRLLTRRHETAAAEIGALISTVTPLTADDGGYASATAREAFGCVAFSVPMDARQLAVTLAHEIQHAKLTALMDALTLVPEPTARRYFAPWRPDPRPLTGLLHGTYAFLGVAGFWRRQRGHEYGERAFHAHVEFARWLEAVRIGLVQLRAEQSLPPLGARFVQGMCDTVDAWAREPVPEAARRAANRALDESHAAWARTNGPLPPRHEKRGDVWARWLRRHEPATAIQGRPEPAR